MVRNRHTDMIDEHSLLFVSNLYERYQAAMMRRAFKYVNNIADAEDIVSNCWLVLIKHASKLEIMVSAAQSTYIMRTVQNAAIDFLRVRQHHSEQLWESTTKVASWLGVAEPLNKEAVVLQREMIMTYFSLLPPHEQKALRLKLYGLRAKEVARAMKVSVSSVRCYQSRAIKRLRVYVGHEK